MGSFPHKRWKRVIPLSIILINLACILEKADESLLPAVYKELAQAFNATPSDLGVLTFIRALVQAIFSPLAGMLTIRYSRPLVIGFGTVFWALSTAAVALSHSFIQCALWRAVNGIGLAIVIPATQSYVADSHVEGGRGVAFGWLSLVGTLGGIAGSMTATIAAGYDIMGVPGWRLVFLVMAIFSSLIGYLVHHYVRDPKGSSLPSLSSEKNHGVTDEIKAIASMWKDSLAAVRSIFRVRTFKLIVLQGIVGSLPWTAMVFFTLWFQVIGFGHKGAAILNGIFSIGTALGALAGGYIGDAAAKRFPNGGRIMCAQLSSVMGIPFSWLLLHVLPQEQRAWPLFAATLALMGLAISWNSACANNPMFAEVVPIKHRTMIYAFDRAVEGGFSAIAAPMVGILADKVYGYGTSSSSSAYALSRGLFAMMAIPFGLCSLSYIPLYFTYGKDRAEASYSTD